MSIVHLAPFVDHWQRLRLEDEDLQALEHQLMKAPTAGAVMVGTGGLRKIRFAPPSWGRGKRGATRIGYADFPMGKTIYLVTLFAKSEKTNLTAAERTAIRGLLARITRSRDPQE